MKRYAAVLVAALGISVLSGPTVLAAVEPGGVIVLAFEPGCRGSGTVAVVNESKGVVQNQAPVSWSSTHSIVTGLTGGGASPGDRGDRLVVRLLSGSSGELLFASEVPLLPYDAYFDYQLTVRLDCSKIPYRVVEVVDEVMLAFEPGCRGSGTVQLVDETKDIVTSQDVVSWSPIQAVHVVSDAGGIVDRGDRLVVRLLSGSSGEILFSAGVPPLLYEAGSVDRLLAVRLDCSRIPYRIAEHLSWSPSAPTTSTSTGPSGSPGTPPVLVLAFGLAVVAAWAHFSRRHGRQPAAPRNSSVSPRSSARRGC